MPHRFKLYLLICSLFCCSGASAATHIFGRVEYIQLANHDDLLKGKLDTGAKLSSVTATNIERFKKNGEDWLRYDMIDKKTKVKLHFVRRVLRYTTVKNRAGGNADGVDGERTHQRPVVAMRVCLQNQSKRIEVSLVDRSDFLYPMLLGRDAIIEFDGMVDPDKKFTGRPHCVSSAGSRTGG